MRCYLTIIVCSSLVWLSAGSTASAQVRYSGGRAYGYASAPYQNTYYNNNGGYYNSTNTLGNGGFGYGAAGAWNALSRRNGYDPIYVAQPQPVLVQQPVYLQQQPTLYLGGTGYQYAPTVYGSPSAIYRGY